LPQTSHFAIFASPSLLFCSSDENITVFGRDFKSFWLEDVVKGVELSCLFPGLPLK